MEIAREIAPERYSNRAPATRASPGTQSAANWRRSRRLGSLISMSAIGDELLFRLRCLDGLMGRLPADEDEEPALPAAGHDLFGLGEEVIEGAAARRRFEELNVVERARVDRHGRNAADELEALAVEPVEHLADRVLRFVRMAILVLEPGAALLLTQGGRPQVGIEPCGSFAREAEDGATKVRHDAAEPIVESNDDVPAGTHEICDRLKPAERIGRVVQDAVAHHDVELLGFETRTEQIHLQ